MTTFTIQQLVDFYTEQSPVPPWVSVPTAALEQLLSERTALYAALEQALTDLAELEADPVIDEDALPAEDYIARIGTTGLPTGPWQPLTMEDPR